MDKGNLLRFVSKYNLQGLVPTVKWEIKDNVVSTNFISEDKSVLGSVSMKNFESEDSELGIYDTAQLIKMVGVLGNDIKYGINKVGDKMVSMKLSDGSTSANFMLSDLSIIPKVPDLKQLPPFDVEIKLDVDFINKFIKAKGALAEEETFTFITKDGTSEIVLGYSSISTNRISLAVDAKTEGDVSPISFSAKYFKEILSANRDASDASLKISSQGLAYIQFEVGGYNSQYYLVEISQ